MLTVMHQRHIPSLPSGLSSHSWCRLMASRCCKCLQGIALPQKIDLYSNFKRQGKIVVKLLNIYDVFTIAPGTSIYGSFKISAAKVDSVESQIAVMGENDCVWPGGADGSIDEKSDCCLSVRGRCSIAIITVRHLIMHLPAKRFVPSPAIIGGSIVEEYAQVNSAL